MARRKCACGCGRPVTGRRSRRYCSDACRKRHDRGGSKTPHRNASKRPQRGGETRTSEGAALRHYPDGQDVRVTDTDVYCSGCGRLLPNLRAAGSARLLPRLRRSG